MARKTKDQAGKTREALLDAAEVVFQRRGVSSTSLDDIACEAGVSRGAIYWHFKNKNDLFDGILIRKNLLFESLMDSVVIQDDGDPLEILKVYFLEIFALISTNPSLNRIYNIIFTKCEMSGEHENVKVRLQESCRDGKEMIMRFLDRAVSVGKLPADFNVEKAATHLQIQLIGLVYLGILMPDILDLKNESERIISTTLTRWILIG